MNSKRYTPRGNQEGPEKCKIKHDDIKSRSKDKSKPSSNSTFASWPRLMRPAPGASTAKTIGIVVNNDYAKIAVVDGASYLFETKRLRTMSCLLVWTRRHGIAATPCTIICAVVAAFIKRLRCKYHRARLGADRRHTSPKTLNCCAVPAGCTVVGCRAGVVALVVAQCALRRAFSRQSARAGDLANVIGTAVVWMEVGKAVGKRGLLQGLIVTVSSHCRACGCTFDIGDGGSGRRSRLTGRETRAGTGDAVECGLQIVETGQ